MFVVKEKEFNHAISGFRMFYGDHIKFFSGQITFKSQQLLFFEQFYIYLQFFFILILALIKILFFHLSLLTVRLQ